MILFHCAARIERPGSKGSTMSNLSDMIFHYIRVKLYPNYLNAVEGAYIARTDSDKTLSMEDVCQIMKTRSGFSGKYEDLIDYVRQYYNEVAYQLCDGNTVNNGFYSIHPNIGGTFNGVNEVHDHKKHPISFRFSTRLKLRELARHIEVEVDGFADTNGYIDTFTDSEGAIINDFYTPGHMFVIHGHKIKLAGDDPSVGVYFIPEDNPSKAVKATRIAENSPSKITGIAPCTACQHNRIVIKTQYSGQNGRLLKTPRIITSSFIVEAA